MLALHEAGYVVLTPFGENTRYDLVIERVGGFGRVQCKTGRVVKGSMMFRTSSSYYHHPNPNMPAKHYRGQVDFFGVHCRETGGVYLVPIEDAPQDHHASLRLARPRNNQTRKVRWAADYQIGHVRIEPATGARAAYPA